jgi:starch synthase (maltosyl-transferring)
MSDVLETGAPATGGVDILARARTSPSLYMVPREKFGDGWQTHVRDAAAMGFSAVLFAAWDEAELAEMAQAAAGAGVALCLEVAPAVVDEAAEWWEARLASWQAAGVTGFYGALAAVPAQVWARLIAGARARDSGVLFVAATAGVAPAEMAALHGVGFDYAVCSSCWWDFSAGWLNEDAAHVAAVAPALAFAAPPGATGWGAAAALRALRFAATYAGAWAMEAGFAHGPAVRALNDLRAAREVLRTGETAQVVSSPGAAVAVLRRRDGFVVAVNASVTETAVLAGDAILPRLGTARLNRLNGAVVTPASRLALAPGEVAMFEAAVGQNVFLPVAIPLDCDAPRIAIEAITPRVDDGQFPVRGILGALVTVQADVIADGHDKLAAEILVRAADEGQFRSYPMLAIGNDRWEAKFPLERMGRHVFAVVAWKDSYATFVDEVTKKHAAGIDTSLELQEGLAIVNEAATTGMRHVAPKLLALLTRVDAADAAQKREILLSDEMVGLVRQSGVRKFAVTSAKVMIDAERPGAAFAAWYEIFPRSQSGDVNRHGTFRDVIGQLPRIADMGFDVLYFPPIHPIGRTNRKGRNNTLTPAPDDPGSPYAIGAAEGGHDAIHPELGTLQDFHAMRDAAAGLGIELALDFAIQCAPDHPWLKEHPEWFDWRPDGSLRYAENPPKKYEDIVNVDFYGAGAKPSLWLALRDVVQFWVNQGVKLFRVDNPHTKPLPFWEWLIADIRSRHADVVFLAEAFTRPKVMYRLAKIGFSQSYTYFTWRNTKAELEEYLTEISTQAPKDYFRPHFFVNTPDINPVFLQKAGRPGHLIRAALAATLSGLWGVYNGFELCEATPVAPGKEEYLNSEKYEIKAWDYDRPGNIVAEITKLNKIRRANAALHTHLNIEFLPCGNDNVIYFRKFAADGNVLLVAISLDPYNAQDATIELPLWRFGLPDDGALQAVDLMRDFAFTWVGKYQPVRLNPEEIPFCIWRIFS